jgi:hypothetical protein
MPMQVEASVELEPPMRARVVTAAVNFGLTAYAALTVGAVKALHCVHAPGTLPSEQRLFIQGTLACDYGGWQAPYVVLGVVLVGTPAALPFLAAWARQPTDGAVRRGVRRALVDPYRDGAYWWEAVLMAQRLVRCVLNSRMSTRLSALLCPGTVLSYAPVVWVGVLLCAEHLFPRVSIRARYGLIEGFGSTARCVPRFAAPILLLLPLPPHFLPSSSFAPATLRVRLSPSLSLYPPPPCSLHAQVLALVFTFASSQPGVQSLVLNLLCVAFLVAHGVVAPLANPQSQALQTTLLACLAAVALSGTPFADALDRSAVVAVSSKATAADDVSHTVRVVGGVAVPALAVAWAYLGEWVIGRLRTRGLGYCRRPPRRLL